MTTPNTTIPEGQNAMTDDQIKHMVDRFLQWKLPVDFNPDAGITFKADFNEHTAWPMKHEPVGTNLLTADQANVMVRFMLADDAPDAPRPSIVDRVKANRHRPVPDDSLIPIKRDAPQQAAAPPPPQPAGDEIDWADLLTEAADMRSMLERYGNGKVVAGRIKLACLAASTLIGRLTVPLVSPIKHLSPQPLPRAAGDEAGWQPIETLPPASDEPTKFIVAYSDGSVFQCRWTKPNQWAPEPGLVPISTQTMKWDAKPKNWRPWPEWPTPAPSAAPPEEGAMTMRAVISRCADQFRFYENQHSDKHTDEGDAKARANAIFADMCETALVVSTHSDAAIERMARAEWIDEAAIMSIVRNHMTYGFRPSEFADAMTGIQRALSLYRERAALSVAGDER